jgi:hypothetical protein
LRIEGLVVDCWIGVVEERDRRIVTLAGRLSEEQVPELLQVCAQTRLLQLDLRDLLAADAAGVDALRRMRARGALLVGIPGYIRMKLESSFAGAGMD